MTDAPRKLLKPAEWPAGHRAALAVVVDLDPSETLMGSWSSPFLEAGAHRLLAMLADLDVIPTAIVDPMERKRFALPPDIDLDPAVRLFEAPLDVNEAIEACQERVGKKPRGLVLEDDEESEALDAGDHWVVDGTGGPFPQQTGTGNIVLPYNPWWRDGTWLAPGSPAPPSALLEHWSLSLASVRSRGELMTIYLSIEISGHPGHVETIQRFLDETIGAGDVWITNGSGVADVVRSSLET